MATGAEPSFHLIGFLAAVSATALRAFKSVLQVTLACTAARITLCVYVCMHACVCGHS